MPQEDQRLVVVDLYNVAIVKLNQTTETFVTFDLTRDAFDVFLRANQRIDENLMVPF
ncbi:hypothetical protein Pla110_17890 [Polystyrenella longa]|uniref:Uncharacterized protein n=1 Tax=Polystyrenella longa TaxID=2528007 RepID=A0A518CLG4_9PLAN|nr:hypothetical protein Pla110_17890 [Polystyrenella longa]